MAPTQSDRVSLARCACAGGKTLITPLDRFPYLANLQKTYSIFYT